MMMISAFLSTPTIPLVFHDYQTKQHPFLSPHPSTLLFLKNKFHKKRDCPFGNSVLIICRASGSSDGSSPPLILEQYPSSQVEQRMKDLAESMVLSPTFLIQLPNDLKSDLKDAAFALSNGPVQRECGELAGEKLVQLSLAWEKGDSQAAALAADGLRSVLPEEIVARTAVGRRLIDAGRRFASMGSYDKGELQKVILALVEDMRGIPVGSTLHLASSVAFWIAKALTSAGEVLYVSDASKISEEPQAATRTYKFGDLQVELTAQKCYIGCLVAFAFGSLSWGLTNSLQNTPESTLQFANDNATLLATSLRGTLLLLGFGSTCLSGLTLVGLLGLGFQLSSKSSPDE